MLCAKCMPAAVVATSKAPRRQDVGSIGSGSLGSSSLRWLTLALVLLAFSSRVAASIEDTCIARGKKAVAAGAVPRSAQVTLVWGSQPARAAAAILRAVLLAAGHPPTTVTLQEHRAAHRLCSLLAANLTQVRGSVVAVSVTPETRCEWTGSRLEVVGSGAAPLHPALHARLAPTLPPADACLEPPSPPVLRDHTWLQACGFLSVNATVYLLEGEWEKENDEIRELLRASGARVRFQSIGRDELGARVQYGEPRSFLFVDAQLWRDASGVVTPRDPPPAAELLVADRAALVEHAPALLLLLENGTFRPRARDLRLVLANARRASPERAACELTPAPAGLATWVNIASQPAIRLAALVICRTEDMSEYEMAARIILPYFLLNTIWLKALHARFAVRVFQVDCARAGALADLLVEWHHSGLMWRTVGVATPAHLVPPAAPNARVSQLPLVAYTPTAEHGPGETEDALVVRAATGSAERLATLVGALVGACEWTRLGIVSEEDEVARAVSAELARMPQLATHEESAAVPVEAVRSLRRLDTRVFFVNCEAEGAARVLAAGLNASTADDRHVWIVRAYAAPDAATAALHPLVVSFSWRGGSELQRRWPLAAPGGPYLHRLDHHWTNRTWPQHVAAALDALITLGVGFQRLVTAHPRVLDEPQMDNKTRYFWEGVQRTPVQGLLSELDYGTRGVRNACVYLDRWNATERPDRLDAWCGTDRPAGCLVEKVFDGSSDCLLPGTENRYRPKCYTGAWLGGAVAVGSALAALGGAVRLLRRWVARRDRRVEQAATARVLARREAAFASLAPHLVARVDLHLGEELGAGRFGRVRHGEVRGKGRRRRLVVAVKELREGASPAEETQFLREARLLAALRHDHVVQFRGVCWEGGPPLLLMELALFGDLRRYLRARRHLVGGAGGEASAVSPEALTRLAREGAAALSYLGAQGLVHRDVRAANCLVDARRSLRLGDFGLARETGAPDGEYTCRGRALFPVLWMAPESLARGVATPASDAWSFGVLALELVTLGARPWGSVRPEEAVRAVLAGGRPPLPRATSPETRALLAACWRREPAARPPAARLAAWLQRRPTALRPALAPDPEEPNSDSGIGDPDAPSPSPPPPPPTANRRSISFFTLPSYT